MYTHTQKHTSTRTNKTTIAHRVGNRISSFLHDCCVFSLLREKEEVERIENEACCFVLHILNVAPKKKPLGVSPSYAL